MEPSGRLTDKLTLDNGLTVHFYDRSTEVAGDRRQIKLFIHIPIPVEKRYFDRCADPRDAYEAFASATGSSVSFQTEKVRNFIDSREAEQTLHELREEFLKASLSYLSRPDFAERLVLRRYGEWLERQQNR